MPRTRVPTRDEIERLLARLDLPPKHLKTFRDVAMLLTLEGHRDKSIASIAKLAKCSQYTVAKVRDILGLKPPEYVRSKDGSMRPSRARPDQRYLLNLAPSTFYPEACSLFNLLRGCGFTEATEYQLLEAAKRFDEASRKCREHARKKKV